MSKYPDVNDGGYFKAVTIDECPDSNGNWSMRFADGTANGNTEQELIATFYRQDTAIAFAENWNSLGRLIEVYKRSKSLDK